MNELHAEFNFQSRCQGPGESVADFLAALCTLLVDLKVNGTAAQECLLAEQLVFGRQDRSVMLQLLEIGEVDFKKFTKSSVHWNWPRSMLLSCIVVLLPLKAVTVT